MIYHTVLFKWKPGINQLSINHIFRALYELKTKIPVIIELQAGENFSERSDGYTHILFVKFKSREDLEIYQLHNDHQEVLNQFIKPNLESLAVGDFEV